MRLVHLLVTAATLVFSSATEAVPPRVKEFQDGLRGGRQCSKMLASGLRSSLEGPKCIDKVNPTRQQVANNLGLAWYYCGDYANTAGSFLYAASSTTASSSRPSSNLTIDCNGIRDGPDDTGLCDRLYRGPTRSTAFQSRMKADGFPAKDLNPYFHPYVALGDFRDIRRREEYVHFDPQDQVVEPLSIVAVVCNDKLVRTTPAHTELPLLRPAVLFCMLVDMFLLLSLTDLWPVGRYQQRHYTPTPRRSAVGRHG